MPISKHKLPIISAYKSLLECTCAPGRMHIIKIVKKKIIIRKSLDMCSETTEKKPDCLVKKNYFDRKKE